ncbi:MAG: immunoglobulin domain-containing protein [Verrucomicrobia bacterium]|nr:immunoglobulin domain-containing protein [Verrucomicrobiota bacterium]
MFESSNAALLPVSRIRIGGEGSLKVLKLFPVAGQAGTSTVTIRTTDAGGLSSNANFLLTVASVSASAPVLEGVVSPDSETVAVFFSKPVNPGNTGNYSVNLGVSIVEDQTDSLNPGLVILKTSPMLLNTDYTLNISGITDSGGTAIAPNPTQAVFRSQDFGGDLSLLRVLPSASAKPLGSLNARGFAGRGHYAGIGLPNSRQRTEDQLTGALLNPATGLLLPNLGDFDGNGQPDGIVSSFILPAVINFNIDTSSTGIGRILGDTQFPGLPFVQGPTNGMALEFVAYVELRSGIYRMGVNSDDGFTVQIGGNSRRFNGAERVLGLFDGGRGAADTIFEFAVFKDGLYPMRLTWEQGEGGANLEWWIIPNLAANASNGTIQRELVNGSDLIRAFLPPPPTIEVIPNQAVNEGSALQIRAVTDGSVFPSGSITYQLEPGAPAGVAINPATGLLTWSPTEAQGPSVANLSIRATDTGLPPLSATQIFTVTVNEVNVSPVVNPISSQTIGEGSPLSFSVSASDSDIPANNLAFSLGAGAPAGASISSGGFFSWTPTDAQGPGFFNITVQVSDGSLTAVQSFSVTVIEGNRSPLISAISSQTVNEGSLLNVQVQASDPDLPAQSLSYSLGAGAPPGASIGGSSGVFSWTPTETQGPGTYSIAVIVRDSGPGNLTANQSFSVTVNEVNQPPLLAGLSDQGVPEGSELSLFVAAADADLPPNKLTFSLRGAPSGATIDPASGIFTWTPTEAQGPSTNSITVVVTDDGPGTLSASQSFTVRVFEINSPPVLAPIPNQAVASGQPFSRTVAATDPDLPANALSYSLPFGGPAGSSINPVTGVFSWTPDAFSGASTNSITVQVSDNGSPLLSATQTFTLVVTVSNKAPEIANIADQTVDEEKALNIAVTATDLDIPTQTVTYGLAPGAPVGAAIDPVTGAFSWTPTEAQGPGSNTITVQARDSGVPPLTGTKSFTVVVREVNQPPTMGPIGDRTVLAGSPLSAPVSAADADLPPNTLTFALGAGAPAGATIDATTGLFSWTPSPAAGPSTNTIGVIVTDNGVPRLIANQTFRVVVQSLNRAPVISPIGNQTVAEETPFALAVLATDADLPAQTLAYSITGAPNGMSINSASGLIAWTPTEDHGPSTNRITIRVADNGVPPQAASQEVTVVVTEVNRPPSLAGVPNQTLIVGNSLNVQLQATDVDLPPNILSYNLGAGAPAGVTVNAGTGLISWTPTAAQGLSTNNFSVTVTDNGTPNLSTNVTFRVVVALSNAAPTLGAIPNQTVDEGSLLSLTITGADADLPQQPLRYGLLDPVPPGAQIDAASGLFTWTPTEAQGPSTNQIRVRVTDSVTPPLSATNGFNVVVREVNLPPSIAPIPDQTVNEVELLTVAVRASDPDLPPNVFQFALGANAPAGAAINPATGVFTWTPTRAQGPSTNVIAITVSDGGTPNLSTNATFRVVVNEINSPPVLAAIANQRVDEGTPLTFTAAGTDLDLPPQTLQYSLGVGAPSGASINAATGVFTWTPTEVQGPSTNVVSVRVTDSGTPIGRASQEVTIVVNEVNAAPVINTIPDLVVGLGGTLTVTASARDSDLPANILRFSLQGAPTGASINATNGVMTWAPAPNQAASTNRITIVVTDNGPGTLSANTSFTAVVGVNVAPTLSSITAQTVAENGTTTAVAFTLTDPDTPLVNFKFIAVSSDPALVPNENIIIGGTGANRTVQVKPAADKSGTATITLTATEPAGGNAVTAFDLTVAPLPPGITRQPADREALAGGEATFSVTATGSRPIAYQWSKGGTLLPGATNAVLVISNVQTNNAGLYSVAVSNRQGSITSREAALAVVVPLRITQQPVSQKVLAGGNVTLSVVAEGAGPLTYEWSVNGVAIPGAVSANLQLNAVEAILSGGYTVVVKNAAASVTSAPAQLDVVAPVVITTQPADLSVPVGTNVTFRVEATGSAPIRYQWRHNGVDLPGQTNSVLTLSNLAASNSGGYSVAASNAGGTVTGAGGNLVVSAPPTISRQPQSKAVLAGAPVSFEVTVSGTPPLAYQWRFDGTNIPGATGPALNLPSVASTASGGYSVIVSNPGGTVTSEVATLTVTQGVVITAQPSDQTVAAGGSASFSVAATGSQPLTYQWRFKGVDIPAATNQTLTVSAVLAANAGGYQVFVANAAGPVPSAVANLTVNVGVTIVEQPQSLTVTNGSSVAFSVLAAGSGPLAYQWRFNGANIPGATQANLAVPNVQPANAGAYSVVVQNVVGSVPSANANLSVIIPPTIQTQPSSQSVNLLASVTLSVVATGDAPMSYQWQKNGGSIPGATGSSLTIGAVNPSDSGSYTVVVQNPGGAVTSQAAILSVILPPLQSGNSATTAGNPIQSAQGSFDLGSNAANGAQIARRNAPPAAGSERWFSWRAPSSGIVTFNTAGSTFDTLLVVYTGTPPNLTEIARDDDRGGFLASEVPFNAVQGTTYLVNVQGFGGAAGQIVVSFNLNATAQQLPVLTIVPQSRTAAVGSAVTFTVSAGGTNLSYQWLRNGAEIAGQTTTSLNLSNIQEADASNYSVRVTSSGTGTPVSVETLPALLQISTANTLSEDKFLNAPRLSGGVQLQSLGGSLVIPPPSKQAGGSVARGFSGSQVFNTFGASKEQGEPNHCDEVGGASQWFTYVAPETGVVRVSTEGSNFDTVLAIYTGPGTSFASLVLVGCDNNSGSDGKTSAVNLRVTKDTQYFVAVDGVGGATGSVKLNYEFAQGPSIAAQPQSVSVKQGDQVVFTVQLAAPVAGAATVPSTYQWTKNGFPIAGETANNLAYASVALANAGDYAVVVSNFAGSTTSDTVRLDVSVPLAISVQPVDRLSGVGETVSFAVVASGSDPITYQWQLNGVNVAAATAASYEIQNVQTTHGGVYSVVITNPVGFVTSATATLTINEAPTVTVRPVDVAAVLGDQATFSVEAIGTGTLSYQWRLNGVNIAGANQASLVLNAVGSENVGDYTVVVSNATGAVVSPSARLSVQVPLSLVEVPESQQLGIGSTAIFNVRASGSGTLSYQWRLNSTNIPGATEPTLALTDVQPASSGIYSVLVTSGAESIESAGAILSVSALPLISTQPQSMVAYAGSDVTFSVAATGSGPLQYQWFVNGQPIDTATASNLTLTGVGLVDAGSYSVSVRNSAGAVSSDLAILTVREIISNLAQNAFTGVDQTVTEFRFRVSVPEGRQARIQVSTDFVDWTDLTPTPVTGILDVEDPDAPSLELRFYRVLDAGAAQ